MDEPQDVALGFANIKTLEKEELSESDVVDPHSLDGFEIGFVASLAVFSGELLHDRDDFGFRGKFEIYEVRRSYFEVAGGF